MPEMQPVSSSNVARIGYETDTEEVYVEFFDSGTYVYVGVPPVVFEEFERCGSKGKFVNEVLKPRYPFHRL